MKGYMARYIASVARNHVIMGSQNLAWYSPFSSWTLDTAAAWASDGLDGDEASAYLSEVCYLSECDNV